MPLFRAEQKIRGFTPRINTHDIKLVTSLLKMLHKNFQGQGLIAPYKTVHHRYILHPIGCK